MDFPPYPYQQSWGQFRFDPTYTNTSGQQPISGRLVTSIKEVEASPIPLDGTVTYFPRLDGKVIYTKYIDMNGNAVVASYTIYNEADKDNKKAELAPLEKRVSKLEALVQQMKGDADNGHDATDSVNAELK